MDERSSVLQELRRESLDIYNRLHSIADDAAFVAHVHEFYPALPLVPNLRCGAWYTDPAIASNVPAYFKSTDGHFNNWSFNLRRPNLHLLPLIAEHHGIVLVDSTRAGKRIPDALSKTVPIWCAVVNRAIARRFPGPDGNAWDTALYTPPGAVSAQEHHQIEQRIDAWADALFNSSFELPALPAPLRPFWITPATTTFPSFPTFEPLPFHPVICLSASRPSDDTRRLGGFGYIQGSGDDHELWSMGLTPTHYWRHTTALLAASRSELPGVIRTILSSDCGDGTLTTDEHPLTERGGVTSIAKVGGRMKLCTFRELGRARWDEDEAYVFLPATPDSSHLPQDQEVTDARRLVLPLAPRIKNHLTLTLLPRALPFIGEQLALGQNVYVVCGGETTNEEAEVGDEGVAVLLTALVLFFCGEGVLRPPQFASPAELPETVLEMSEASTEMKEVEQRRGKVVIPPGIDKTCIRTRLEWIIACRPGVNPARATLKRVNEFLMSGEHGRR
ncbi:putative initiator tRNA phosphoribosyl transferase [Lyophyllum shimeji]|uniref:Initiator tRNA phosphoribosyl transferase n=1 Tax=Lyophyllum shimeji TaxID=47721 RepID=A0A9P3PL08_LYOSH|nr:putative initiator tRNA phosphoribosyl transferase [Lyophyllum shimeji]